MSGERINNEMLMKSRTILFTYFSHIYDTEFENIFLVL